MEGGKYEGFWVNGLFGWEGKGGEKMVGLECFLPRLTTLLSPQIREKMVDEEQWRLQNFFLGGH